MKIETNEKGEIILKEVYSGISLQASNLGENIGICIRDGAFEFNYGGQWYTAKGGFVIKRGAPQEPERIEVSHIAKHDTFMGNKWDSYFYQFCASQPIQQDVFPFIKAAIEQVLNSTTHICKHCNAEVSEPDEKCYKAPPTTPAPESRDWEILEFECYGGERRKLIDGEYRLFNGGIGFDADYLLAMANTKIISVCRLRDNTTWTVGEITDGYKNTGIKEFYIRGGKMFAITDANGEGCSTDRLEWRLESLIKLPPKPQPLFVTEDGKEIFDGNEVWLVTNLFKIHPTIAQTGCRYASKTFSTKEAADEYVLMNKPCLSLKEVSDIDMNTVSGSDFEEALLKLVKSKQS